MSDHYLIDTDIIIYWLKDTYPKIKDKIGQSKQELDKDWNHY